MRGWTGGCDSGLRHTRSGIRMWRSRRGTLHTDKKEEKNHIRKLFGLGAKSFMRKGSLMYDEMRKYLVMYGEDVSHTVYDFAPDPF
jgi:hypothetical protein